MGTCIGTGNCSYFLAVSEPVSEKVGTGKSLGTSIGKIWYRKKVSEPVSGRFGADKKYQYWYRKYLVPEKKYRYRLTNWVQSHIDIRGAVTIQSATTGGEGLVSG